ncbi:MAG: dihydrolipoamide acetyltransferase family protein [Sporolactobacillus sp.]
MATEIIMPKMGMGMEEGTVVEWLKHTGDPVKKGESVVSISSDKIEKELEAPEDGILLNIEAEEDSVVEIGKALGYIGQSGEKIEKESSNNQRSVNTLEESSDAGRETRTTGSLPSEIKSDSAPRLRVSPAARRLAKAESIDLKQIEGTGPLGRITKADVAGVAEKKEEEEKKQQAVLSQPETSAAENRPIAPLTGSGKVKKISGMRKVIADRMFNSLKSTAQLTLQTTADVTQLLAFQKQVRAAYPADDEVRLTITDFIAKATVHALLNHPAMNTLLQGDTLTRYTEVHLGVAVALDEGLVVPVIKDADKKSLSAISREIHQASQMARSGQLENLVLSGSTFTVTSLGAYGIGFFTPVLNPPEIGILGVGTINDQPVYSGDQLERRSLLPLSLTFDHRAIDGAQAAAFLTAVKSVLETPFKLVL